ncbi:hypothetical protein GCM10011346_29490 [Oceanobacillus neutriphilus]|uniref:Uncharacterized protein n=1 Tax=Oceanobacillus neutriphilus TaxID=531815 RepID=A0ABQ2NX64_9BACI|nr:hypothetical protein GCM10011346_29490 [Oceanobacillus neutriphilus]
MDNEIIMLLFILAFIVALGILFRFVPLALWISALAAGVKINIFTLIGLRLRRIDPKYIVNPLIKAHLVDIDVTINQLEKHYLAGGNIEDVVNGLIAAERVNIDLSFERAAAIDLEGSNVLETVKNLR